MSEDEEASGTRPFMKFRVRCPNCADGVRHRARMGVRDGQVGTGHIAETCPDCEGTGYIPLNNGEWKGRPKPTT